jgi:cell division septation protein DedD
LKVAPQDPGGVEIPNQSKQIYERSAQDTQTRVVNREEQPIDVRQATRSAGIPANPSMQRLATDALGEPRRVRTVTIRPSDGAIVMPDQSGAARAVAAPPVADPSPATPAKVLPPQRPRDATSTPAPRPGPGASATEVPVRPSAQSAAEASPPRMAAAPQAILREPTETSAAPVISPGFTVQLGVRNTDRDARSLFDQLQQRYGGDLKGFSPIVREAEINGKTAYRLRVGPMSREDATALCVRLKSAGGQCFVANN